MNTSKKGYKQSYCNALNAAWISTIQKINMHTPTANDVMDKDFMPVMRDGKAMGFQFVFEMDPRVMLRQCVEDADIEREIVNLAEWKKIGPLIGVIKICQYSGGSLLTTDIEKLKQLYVEDIMETYAKQYILENGPFFWNNGEEQICIAGFSGRVLDDFMLIVAHHKLTTSK